MGLEVDASGHGSVSSKGVGRRFDAVLGVSRGGFVIV